MATGGTSRIHGTTAAGGLRESRPLKMPYPTSDASPAV